MRRPAEVLAVFLILAVGGARAGFDEGKATLSRVDYATALRELRPLAEQGDVEAQNGLGFMYEWDQGIPQNDAEAVRWYRLAAEQSDADAQKALGRLEKVTPSGGAVAQGSEATGGGGSAGAGTEGCRSPPRTRDH